MALEKGNRVRGEKNYEEYNRNYAHMTLDEYYEAELTAGKERKFIRPEFAVTGQVP
jgi:hypothetical protein